MTKDGKTVTVYTTTSIRQHVKKGFDIVDLHDPDNRLGLSGLSITGVPIFMESGIVQATEPMPIKEDAEPVKRGPGRPRKK